jgi:hypothetical protein
MTMKVYTVHEPRKLTGDPVRDAERFVFVRDGFHVWAFLLGPLWMLWHRMWLVLLGYVVLSAAVQAGLWALGAPSVARWGVGFLIALLVGFEAATLRRWTLRKRTNVGVVVGRDREDAERRFFDAWIARGGLTEAGRSSPAAPHAANPATPAWSPEASPGVIGLFPEPEPRR